MEQRLVRRALATIETAGKPPPTRLLESEGGHGQNAYYLMVRVARHTANGLLVVKRISSSTICAQPFAIGSFWPCQYWYGPAGSSWGRSGDGSSPCAAR